MKRACLFFILYCFFLNGEGQINQYGVPLIRNYSTQITHGSEQNWCIARDIFGNLYFGAQDQGVIKYDGTRWSQIQIGNNPRIFSLMSDSQGIVYVGAAYEFGFLQPGENGKPEYTSLASRVDSVGEIGFVYSIVILNDKVYFQSPSVIYIYDKDSNSVSKINLRASKIIDAFRLVRLNDLLILADNRTGLYELKDTVPVPLPGGDFFKKKVCTVFLPYDDTKILIGTFYDGLFLYDYITGEINQNFIKKELNEKLKDVSIYAASKIKNNRYAIGTTNKEGVLIFNQSGELVQQINKENSELQDNTIIAMYCDSENNSELWISTQGFISKAYVNLPLSQFSEKQGIESGLNSIAEFQDRLYLSSDAGVYQSVVDKNNSRVFIMVPGTETQTFPLEKISSDNGESLIAGSLTGLIQISGNGTIIQIERNCIGIPRRIIRYNAAKILQSSSDRSVFYFGLAQGGIIILRYDGNRWYYLNQIRNLPGSISDIAEKKEGGLWFMSDDPDAVYALNFNATDTIAVKYGTEKGVTETDINSVHSIKDEVYITTNSGIKKYNNLSDTFISDNSLTGDYSSDKTTSGLFVDPDNALWYSGLDRDRNSDMLFITENDSIRSYSGILRLLPDVPLSDILYSNGRVYLIKSKTLFVVDKKEIKADTTIVNTSFVRITAGPDSVIMEGTFFRSVDAKKRIPALTGPGNQPAEFGYDMNRLSFEWTTPWFTEELQTEYSYKLEGYEDEWSEWEGISFANNMEAQYFKKEYINLPHGRYSFRVRTKTLTGQTGKELRYDFIILKPWYATMLALVGFFIAAMFVIIAIIAAYTRKLKNENLRLEGIVTERTAVVVKQKDELESSIHYASRIQMALLPSEALLSENISNYFVLFRPRDIVSGDFYWMTKQGERLYIVAADCTGHGVPGAFMSLLGMSFLDEIIDKEKALRADVILHELRLHVTESLKQVGGEDEAKDGMDIGLLVIDFKTQKMEYSGAYNPCFRVRKLTGVEAMDRNIASSEPDDGSMSDGKYLLETIHASKMPIGISSRMQEEFVFHEWDLEKGVSYYLFTDGYIDQFGGPAGRKFMKKNFKTLILEIQDHSMAEQKNLLDNNLKKWMGSSPQIDDILVMGIRID